MTRAQQNLRAWAYGLARQTLKRVDSMRDTDVRVSMLRSILDELQPGLSSVVEKRAITFRRLGHPYDAAMEHALAEQFMKIGAEKLNRADTLSGLGTVDAGTTNDILGGITSLVTSLTSAAERIHGMVEETRANREAQRQARREWRSESELAALEAEERVRAAREERERRALEAERERESDLLRDERDRERAAYAPSGPGIGTILIGGAVVTAVGVAGYYGYRAIKGRKSS